uniref:Uncharacterized protein n=1 Tax=Anguilla anguilla TaxID=7936 RepID=A0A0E9RVI6_ANGAN
MTQHPHIPPVAHFIKKVDHFRYPKWHRSFSLASRAVIVLPGITDNSGLIMA